MKKKEPKVADKENKFIKMLRLISLLNRWEYQSGESLAQYLGVSLRTFYRYVNNINEAFFLNGGDIIKATRDGYKLNDTNFLDYYQGINDISVIAAIETTTFGDALSKKPVIPQKSIEKISRRIQSETKIEGEILRTILTAMSGNNTITINYIRHNDEEKKYLLVPLRLTTSDGVLYLQSYCIDYKQVIHQRVSKILEAIPGEFFTDTKLIEEKLAFIKSRWGFMANDAKNYHARVIFTVDTQLDRSLIVAPLHSSQSREVRDRKVYYTLDIHNVREFVLWAMKHSYHLQVDSPQWVIDEFRNQAFDILKRYPKQ